MPKCIACYCSISTGLSVAALDYLRRGDAKNFPWRENPTDDLLLLPNLQQRVHIMTFNGMELVNKTEAMKDNEILYSRLTSMKDVQKESAFLEK